MSSSKNAPTAYAVLGLLSFGQPLTGYELRQWALKSLRFMYWTPAQSQIYRELRALEAKGLVVGTAIAQSDKPNKKRFAITPAGTVALAEWANETALPPTVIKHHAALRTFLAHTWTPQARDDALDRYIDEVEAALGVIEALAVGLDDADEPSPAKIALEWTRRIYAADMEGAVWAKAQLANTA